MNKKLLEFTQSETKAKQFRHDYPISEESREKLLQKVYPDFAKYIFHRRYSTNFPLLEEFMNEHHIREEKKETLEHNMFWWQVLYEARKNPENNAIEDYIEKDPLKENLMTSWLREWKKAVPKFYYVGYKYNDRILVMVDILTQETLDVIVYDPTAIPSEKGEIVMGTLIPIGDALYFPIIDFYHFDFAAREDLAGNLTHFYNKYLETSTLHEAFIHVLSAALQIERINFLENQNTSYKN
ncbi:hypothetical protein [Oceanobacillus senegalensis]|uniref:hypothetical protein n=1 Tax=Oceanobacillus senegalensis TaxID=1936063 RepID=UPI000A3138A7|nr:hypothetical protein [Oceanobacillus senegalensis]